MGEASGEELRRAVRVRMRFGGLALGVDVLGLISEGSFGCDWRTEGV